MRTALTRSLDSSLPVIRQIIQKAILLGLTAFILVQYALPYRINYSDIRSLDHTAIPAKQIHFPYMAKSDYSRDKVPEGNAKRYAVRINAVGYPGQQLIWRISGKSCISGIRINQEKITLNPRVSKHLCQGKRRITLNLTEHTVSGNNQVEFTLQDISGGTYGLNIRPMVSLFGYLYFAEPNTLMIAIAWLFVLLLRHLKFDPLTTGLSMFSLLLYWHNTSILSFHLTPDWWGHIPYINYISRHWLPPPAYRGWEDYHPPLYYYTVAILDNVRQAFGMKASTISAALTVAVFSVLAFNLYAMLLFRECIRIYWLRITITVLLIFWPLAQQMSVRISNEVFCYVPWAAGYYYIYLWWKTGLPRYYMASLVACGVFMLIKVSAIILIGTLGLFSLIQLYRKQHTLRYFFGRTILYGAVFLLLCSSLTFGRTLYYKYTHDPRMGFITSNIHKDPILHMIHSRATWHNMMTLDIYNMRKLPYVGLTNDFSGRRLFWNTYIKTLGFGYKSMPFPNYAIYVNCTMTLILLFTIFSPLFVLRLEASYAYLYVAYIFGLGAQIINRIIVMTTVTNEARLTYPIIILLFCCTAYITQLMFENRKYVRAYIGAAILLGGAISSTCYSLKLAGPYRLLDTIF